MFAAQQVGSEEPPAFGRRHLFEIHEQAWCPASLRLEAMSFLETFSRLADVYGRLRARLLATVERCGAGRVYDLCSGGGGPWPSWLAGAAEASELPRVVLTDAYPNPALLTPGSAAISYHPEPVDALRVPAELAGFRTLFASLHHFRPPEAAAILRDAVAAGEGIAACEPGRRHLTSMLAVAFIPLALWLAAPFLRPFRWSRLLWTYLVPALPVVLTFDGWVSCLRTYSPAELRQLAAAADPEGTYHWQIGEERMGRLPLRVTYILGWPKSRVEDPAPAG